MAVAFSIWKDHITNVVYRVADDAQSKVVVSGSALDLDLWFTGQSSPALTNSGSRPWLLSIPNA